MKTIALSLLFFVISSSCFAQLSLEKLSLRKGKYGVGFQHYVAVDSSRTYNRIFDLTHRQIYRPIPISIWYPATAQAASANMTTLDYMEILKEEEEWEQLPNEHILNWFYYRNSPQNQQHLAEKTGALRNAEPVTQKFPVIIYAPSYQASSIENFALCEMLVSHGYVVIASPSRGADKRMLEGGTAKDLEAQARDIEFLIGHIARHKQADMEAVATMGFSFGGLSNVLAQMRNARLKAIVSLDGSIRYQYATLQQSPFADTDKVNVPFIHMAQKEIPEAVMKEKKLDPALNNEFVFFDSLRNSRAYSLRFHHLTHSNFSTLGVLFHDRDPQQDMGDPEIMASYKWVAEYSLQFLDAFLKEDEAALAFMEREAEANGVPDGLISKKAKSPQARALTFEDFNDKAAAQGYQHLHELYESCRREQVGFSLEEWKLNTLGLQLVFNPATSRAGIDVFILATRLYPQSSNLFDSLAEAYLFTGDTALAIANFEKSLELNAGNQNAIDRLQQLKK